MKNYNNLFKGLTVLSLAFSLAVATPVFADNGNGKSQGNNDKGNSGLHLSLGQRFQNFFGGFFSHSNGVSTSIAKDNDNDNDKGNKGGKHDTQNINAVVSQVSSSSAKIIWGTKVGTASKVFYSTVSPATSSGSFVVGTQHGKSGAYTATITGLTANTKYYFTVVATNATSTVATSKERTFTTRMNNGLGGDVGTSTSPTVISYSNVFNINTTSAYVVWVTSKPTIGSVYYGTSTPVANATGTSAVSTNVLDTFHQVILTGLTPGTTYHFIVTASANGGLVTATSTDQTFITLGTPDVTAPVISTINATSTATSTAHISWQTNEPATSLVLYSTSTPVGSAQSVASTSLVTNHQIDISGLATSSTYYFTIQSSDASGNTTAVYNNSFLTH